MGKPNFNDEFKRDAVAQNTGRGYPVAEVSQRFGFAERLTRQRQPLEMLTTDLAALERQLAKEQPRITPEIVERFGTLLRTNLRQDDPALRQSYVRLLVDEVQVAGNDIRIRGSKKALEHAVLTTANRPGSMVPSFARKWRTRQDSNL